MSHDDAPDRAAIKTALATLEGKYEVRGHKMDVTVALCCYDYKITDIRLSFKLESGKAWGCADGRGVTVKTATRADVQSILDSTLVDKTCTRCKVSLVAEPGSNRGTLCETCWTDDWKKKVDKAQEADRKALDRQDKRMIAKGFTHRVTAWVHAGGDDKQIDLYTTGEPSKEEIVKYLRKAGSRVVDDYKVFPLKG
jgi:uncharacterized Zn finger protein (UPF0148 family)